MKLLLSAYACEPDKGSEPGVGWNWAQALVRQGHQVHVITRANNRPAIENALKGDGSPLSFTYFDLPRWARAAKKWPGGIYLYYLMWQIGAYRLAKKIHLVRNFDCVQHVTFASYRQPSFMGGLGIPFIFGPVGGGETMPAQFRRGISMNGRLTEFFRDLASALISCDPLMRHTFSRANTIACTTSETLARIPRRFRGKCIVQPAIGINAWEIDTDYEGRVPRLQFLFVGRLLYWKGVHLIIRAMASARDSVPGIKLKIIGDGGDRRWLQQAARQEGVESAIEWISAKPHDEISRQYRESIALVFPSLHDSGGMVVLEALAAGVPVICLDLGGPGAMVTAACGVVIEGRQASESSVIESLAQAMIELAATPARRSELSAGAVARAREMTWDAAAEAVYSSLRACY
jgi:glycosyltransferase involved in cell wall biosynthesis